MPIDALHQVRVHHRRVRGAGLPLHAEERRESLAARAQTHLADGGAHAAGLLLPQLLSARRAV